MADAPKGLTYNGTAIWTGRELVVWSATSETAEPIGAAYDPADDRWRTIAAAPDDARPTSTAVWTGTEILYWPKFAYDPAKDSWRKFTAPPFKRRGTEAVWLSGEMIVWGGIEGCCPIDSTVHDRDVIAYDPVADRWRTLPDAPQGVAGDGGPAVSLERDGMMLVFRGTHLYALDPEAKEWHDLGAPTFPEKKMVCMSTNGPSQVAALAGDHLFTWSGGCSATDGAVHTTNDGWSRIADPEKGLFVAAAADDAIYATASDPDDEEAISIVRYSVADDTWSDVKGTPPSIGYDPALMWTGAEVIVWGGYGGNDRPPAGALYTP
jgi:hypothetical protein